jgi:hypothetical protein
MTGAGQGATAVIWPMPCETCGDKGFVRDEDNGGLCLDCDWRTNGYRGLRAYQRLEEARTALLREVEGLKAALDTVRVELGALLVKPNLRAHPSDVPMDLNQADRACVARAFNAARDVQDAALSPASGGV